MVLFIEIKLFFSATPDMVQDFKARTNNPRSVMLDWTPPTKVGLMRYRVRFMIFNTIVLSFDSKLHARLCS